MSKREQDRKRRIRAEVGEIKTARSCDRCGYDRSPAALDLVRPDGAAADVARMISDGAGRARVLAEVARCRVLCANCNRVECHQPEARTAGGR